MLKVQEIREIIKLIDQSSITEFNYESNGTVVSLKKGSQTVANAVQSVPQTVVVETTPQAPVVEKDRKSTRLNSSHQI